MPAAGILLYCLCLKGHVLALELQRHHLDNSSDLLKNMNKIFITLIYTNFVETLFDPLNIKEHILKNLF
jgi:hypothetical protein